MVDRVFPLPCHAQLFFGGHISFWGHHLCTGRLMSIIKVVVPKEKQTFSAASQTKRGTCIVNVCLARPFGPGPFG